MKPGLPAFKLVLGATGLLYAKLRRESRKITGPRRLILRALEVAGRPLTNKEIFQALPKDGCDLATVYRSVQLLEQMGVVKRFDLGGGAAARYALIAEGSDGHRHHLVCTKCTRIEEIGECIVRELEERVATRSKFKAVTHRLEFFGVCPECQ